MYVVLTYKVNGEFSFNSTLDNLLDCFWPIHNHLLSYLSKLHDMDAFIIVLWSWAYTNNHPNLTLSIKEILEKMSQFWVTVRNNLQIFKHL